MTVGLLKVGIASYEEMKARTLAIARGKLKPRPGDPKVWFPSMESLAKVLSAKNRELLRVIAERAPRSLEELAVLTGRRESNLSRTLKSLESYGVVKLLRGPRGRVVARVHAKRISLEVLLLDRSLPRRRRKAG